MSVARAHTRIAAAAAVGLLGTACGPSSAPDEVAPEPSMTEAASPVLARVHGTPITQADLERSVERTLGPGMIRLLDEEAQRKALDSLILNQALAHQVRSRLTPEREAEIEREVEAYRKNLLAREFMRLETLDVPLTEERIEAYYREHPAEFGQRTARRYELLKGSAAGDDATRGAQVALLAEPGAGTEWVDFARQPRVRGAGVTFYRGELTPGLFEPPVHAMIEGLEEGEASEVLVLQGVPYRAQVTRLETIPPRPFPEVRDRAFERVRAIALKRAIEAVSERVLASADVEYLDREGKP